MENISLLVNELLKKPPVADLEALKNESVFNFGNAGETATNQILSIIEDIDKSMKTTALK